MEKIRNMKIRNKLLLSFGSIVAISAVTVVVLLISMKSISTSVDELYEGPYQNVDDIWVVRRNLIDVQRAINRLMAEGSSGLEERYQTFTATITQDVEQIILSLSELETQLQHQDNRDRLGKLEARVEDGEEVRARLMKLLEEGDFDAAYDLNYTTYLPIVDEINAMAVELFNEVSADAEEFLAEADANSWIAIIVGIALVAAGVIAAVFIAVSITKMIVNPVEQITSAARKMYEGNMKASRHITYSARDELGILADCMRGTMNNLSAYVDEISQNLIRIAQGDLTQSGDSITDFKGDFASIKESFVYILKRFNSTLTDIQAAAGRVDSGSTEIAGAAQSLSEGTTEQAGALEELTATIESVSNMAADSSRKTQEAYEKMQASTREAEEGSRQMQALRDEMQRITEISKEIQQIITAIEDIASQTNLLSLNASIEAARAGEAGRGFAVVADQIGKLASDSAQSAVSTRELIIKTLEEIENGNAITVQTSEAFEQVIKDMREFALAARSTNENAESQAAALAQVEGGIEQISGVVQNTASAAEESSSISENLSEEAHRLDELLTRFKLFA